MFFQSSRTFPKNEKKEWSRKSCVWRWFIEQTRPFFRFSVLCCSPTCVSFSFVLRYFILFHRLLAFRLFLGISNLFHPHTRRRFYDSFSLVWDFFSFFIPTACLLISFDWGILFMKSDDFMISLSHGSVVRSLRQKYRKVFWTFNVLFYASISFPDRARRFNFFGEFIKVSEL